MYFLVSPHDKRMERLNWGKLFSFNFSNSAVDPDNIKIEYSLDANQIEIEFPYTEEL